MRESLIAAPKLNTPAPGGLRQLKGYRSSPEDTEIRSCKRAPQIPQIEG